MLLSESRFLTTHAGSLPRPAALAELHGRRSKGEEVDAAELQRAVEQASAEVVAAQVAAGVDVGNDGEQARESFFTYVQHRMTGFGGTSHRSIMRDLIEHPDLLELTRGRRERTKVNLMAAPAAVDAVTYRDTGELEAELALVADAPFAETFMTAASPGIVAAAMENRFYATREEYVQAVAAALRTEYRAIVDRGLLLQIDAPDLALERHTLFAERPLAEFLAWVELVVGRDQRRPRRDRPGAGAPARLLGQLRGPAHPRRGLRRHPAAPVRGARRRARWCRWPTPGTPTSSAASPDRPLPDHMALVAGVIDTTSNYVEHPEVVADRLERVAEAVGDPTRVIAGTDCGFDTSAGIGDVAPSLVWEKLRALRDGADLGLGTRVRRLRS